MLTNIKR